MRTKYSVVSWILPAVVAATQAWAGGHVGGGDPTESEFTAMAEMGIQQLVTRAEELKFDPAAVVRNWRRAPVKVLAIDEELCESSGLCGRIAVTDVPARTIRINRGLWSKLTDSRRKSGIALHEALVLVGVETTGVYFLSARVYGISEGELESGRLGMYSRQAEQLWYNPATSVSVSTDPQSKTIFVSGVLSGDPISVVLQCRNDAAVDCSAKFLKNIPCGGGDSCAADVYVRGTLDVTGALFLTQRLCLRGAPCTHWSLIFRRQSQVPPSPKPQ